MLATAADAGPSFRELGEYNNAPFPTAGCPANCQAVGHVTGYQVEIGKHKNPYVINHRGKIVALTIKLGKPTAKQTTFFTNLFGGRPTVRLSVLKKPTHDVEAHTDLRLVGQSEVFDLTNYLGSTPTFALPSALPSRRARRSRSRCRPGPRRSPSMRATTTPGARRARRVIAAVRRSERSSLSASRPPTTASTGSARLLYTATFLRIRRPTTGVAQMKALRRPSTLRPSERLDGCRFSSALTSDATIRGR